MATSSKRLTISVTPDMEADLDAAKRELYNNETQNNMIRDLIRRGLQNAKTESEQICHRTS